MAREDFTREEAAELERLRRDFEARSDGGASPAVLNLWRVEATAHTVYGVHLGEALKSAAGPVARVWRPKTWLCSFPCGVVDGA